MATITVHQFGDVKITRAEICESLVTCGPHADRINEIPEGNYFLTASVDDCGNLMHLVLTPDPNRTE